MNESCDWRTESDELLVEWDRVDPADVTSLRMALESEMRADDCSWAEGASSSSQSIDAAEEETQNIEATSREQEVSREEDVAQDQQDDALEVTEVLRRRRHKDVPKATAVDDEAEEYNEDDYRYEYLVRWKDMADPTWERRGYLLDEGFGHLVKAFDAAKTPVTKPTSTKYNRPQKPSTGGLVDDPEERMRKAELKATLANILHAEQHSAWCEGFERTILCDPTTKKILEKISWPPVVPPWFDIYAKGFPSVWQKRLPLVGRCRAWFLGDCLWPIAMCPVGNCATREQFVTNVLDKGLAIQPVSHGSTALESIIAQGLRKPSSQGVTSKINTTTAGVGIYTGQRPMASQNYCGADDIMFLCAGKAMWYKEVQWQFPAAVVYSHSSDVVPILAVKFRRIASRQGDAIDAIYAACPTTVVATLEELRQCV